jgi:hypothetical protein
MMAFLADRVVDRLLSAAPPGGWGISLREVPVV